MNSLHITLHQIQAAVHSDPYRQVTPGGKRNFTAFQLKCMNFCGITYFIIVTAFIFVVTLSTTLEVVVEDEEARTFHSLAGSFILFNVVINFSLINFYDSVYKGKKSQTSDDDDPGLPSANWNQCSPCQQLAPPRAHHCMLCRKCILKRDHHCFFTGSCVGFNNQRYFVVFCFYAAFGCLPT